MGLAFGFALPHWQMLSGGTPPPPPTTFDVLPSSGAPTYIVTNDVRNSSGTVFAVLATVLSSNGTSYSPI